MDLYAPEGLFGLPIYVTTLLLVWSLIWKGFALWRAARLKDKNWFIALLIINSIGILDIIYLKFISKGKKAK